MIRPLHNSAARRARSAAFTLIEVLVTLAIVAILVPVVMQSISIATRLGADARLRTEAATLACGKLDELAATGEWQSMELAGDFGEEHPGFRWAASAQPWSGGSAMDELSVEVVWTSRAKERSIVMTTLVESTGLTTELTQ